MRSARHFRGSALGFICVPALLLLSGCGSQKKTPDAPARLKPLNVVLVTIDTLRADRLRCYGYQGVETPVLDALAARGALFESAVAQTPLTPPSHASIFTGTYPNVHKVRNTGGFVLGSSPKTLATILQEQGWTTAAFIGASVLKKAFGFGQGFAHYDDAMPKGIAKHETGEYPERRAGVVVDRALAWLNGQAAKPYFVWLHLYDPHQPYAAPEPFGSKYRKDPYAGEVAYTDGELGRFFKAVAARPDYDQTIFVLLSDHGESLTEHGEYSHGVFLYDATLRIPLIVAGPGVPGGIRVKQQARTIDVLPTVLDLLGGKPPASSQGSSLTPAFSGRQTPTTYSYGETVYPKMNMGWAELRSMRTARWKYVRAPRPELYDLAADPNETKNVIGQFRKEADEMETQLRQFARAGQSERIETTSLDAKTMEQLKSLGYLSGFSDRELELNGKGADPKDRVAVLKVLEEVRPGSRLAPRERIRRLEGALAQDGTNFTIYYHLGSEYEAAGRYPDALKLYQDAVQKGVRNGRLYSRIGDLQLRAGRKKEAIGSYETAAQLSPSDAEVQNNLALAYMEEGRIQDAERAYRWVITTEENAAAYNGLGLISIQRQDPAGARGYFEKAVQLDPDLVEAQLNLGLIYRMTGDVPRARKRFETFLAKASPRQYGSILPKVRQELAAMR